MREFLIIFLMTICLSLSAQDKIYTFESTHNSTKTYNGGVWTESEQDWSVVIIKINITQQLVSIKFNDGSTLWLNAISSKTFDTYNELYLQGKDGRWTLTMYEDMKKILLSKDDNKTLIAIFYL